MYKLLFYILSISLISISTNGQELYYSPAESGVENLTKYEAIGRVGRHILIYRELKSQHIVSVFSNSMNLVRKVELSILPKDVLSVDFINVGSKANMIYQFINENKLFLAYTSLDEEGKVNVEPVIVDSVQILDIAEFPLFQVLVNPSKTMFMLIYLQPANERLTRMSTLLYSNSMQLVEQAALLISTPEGTDKLNQFELDNDGNLVFLRNELGEATTSLSRSDILVKPRGVDEVKNATIQYNKIGIKDLKIAIDNKNNRVTAA